MIAAIRFQQDHLLTTDAISALLDHSAEVAEALGGTRELSPCGAVVILVKESAGQCVPADESYAVVQRSVFRAAPSAASRLFQPHRTTAGRDRMPHSCSATER